jgi:hypothetical protein
VLAAAGFLSLSGQKPFQFSGRSVVIAARIAMLSSWFQRRAAKRLEKKFHHHFERASGSVLDRNAVAIAMMELEDPWVVQVAAEFSAEQQPIFLMAYQCFILWVVTQVLRERLQPGELLDPTKRVRESFASCSYHTPSVFEKIWPYTQQLMTVALQGGRLTEVVYPLPHIIQAAISAGYPLPQKILNYQLGLHVLIVMKRVKETLSPDGNPGAS